MSSATRAAQSIGVPRKPTKLSETLRALLDERRARNPAYSLRALARDLDVSHTTLSFAIHEARDLSAETLMRMSARLPRGCARRRYLRARAIAALERAVRR